jgi:hypothetical protein
MNDAMPIAFLIPLRGSSNLAATSVHCPSEVGDCGQRVIGNAAVMRVSLHSQGEIKGFYLVNQMLAFAILSGKKSDLSRFGFYSIDAI